MTKVQLQVGEKVEGAFLFVGDDPSNNGLDNAVCAMVRPSRRHGRAVGPGGAVLGCVRAGLRPAESGLKTA